MVTRPLQMNSYEYVVLCALRTQQLLAGSVPRVLQGDHSPATTAQMEVASGFVVRAEPEAAAPAQCFWQL